MKGTLAEAKRRVKVGTLVTLVECPWMRWAEGQVREVTQVRSASFALKLTRQDGSIVDSWVDWGRADVFNFDPDTNTFSIPRFGEVEAPNAQWATYRIEPS